MHAHVWNHMINTFDMQTATKNNKYMCVYIYIYIHEQSDQVRSKVIGRISEKQQVRATV